MTTQKKTTTAVSAQKETAFRKQVESELARQLERQEKAAAALETAQDADTLKDAKDMYSNATNRIRYARKLLNIEAENMKKIIAFVADYKSLIQPKDIYVDGDTVLAYAKAAAGISNSLGEKFACWLDEFTKAATVSGTKLDSAVTVRAQLKDSGRRWRNGIPRALQSMGVVDVEWTKDGRKDAVKSATIHPEHPAVKALQERAFLGSIAQ